MTLHRQGEELLRTAAKALSDYIDALEGAELRWPRQREPLLRASYRLADALSDLIDRHADADLEELSDRALQG